VKNAKKNVSLRGGTTKQSAKLLPIPSPQKRVIARRHYEAICQVTSYSFAQKRVIARRNDEAICQVNHENPFFDLFHNVNFKEKTSCEM
jgi:hypothetical protein